MNRISSRQCSLFSVLAALVGVSTALAGGFQLSVEVPPSPADPEFKNAVLLVRTFGCHQPTDATVSATAQGLVKGRRQNHQASIETHVQRRLCPPAAMAFCGDLAHSDQRKLLDWSRQRPRRVGAKWTSYDRQQQKDKLPHLTTQTLEK